MILFYFIKKVKERDSEETQLPYKTGLFPLPCFRREAEFHKTELDIWGHSKDGKLLFNIQINMVCIVKEGKTDVMHSERIQMLCIVIEGKTDVKHGERRQNRCSFPNCSFPLSGYTENDPRTYTVQFNMQSY